MSDSFLLFDKSSSIGGLLCWECDDHRAHRRNRCCLYFENRKYMTKLTNVNFYYISCFNDTLRKTIVKLKVSKQEDERTGEGH